jgi:hypothetical protein
MSIKQVRNERHEPFIDQEGFFVDSGLVAPPSNEHAKDNKIWHESLKPHLRLYHHNTLSSARRHANFVNVK